jgi:hypothetical protein
VIEVSLAGDQGYSVTTADLPVIPDKKYAVSTKAAGISGQARCAFFGVILVNKSTKEPMGRRIRWLDDFTGKEKEFQVIFKVPADCGSLRIIYRINQQTPVKANCNFTILPIEQIKISEANPATRENYDRLANRVQSSSTEELTLEQEDILERNLVWIFYHPNKKIESAITSLFPETVTSAKVLDNPLIGSHFTNTRKMSRTYVRDIDFRADRRDYFFNYKYSKTWKFYFRKLVLNRIYAQFRDFTSIMVVNDPKGSVAADLVMECFPKSKMLLFAQDGREALLDLGITNIQGDGEKDRPRAKRSRSSFISRNAELWRIDMNAVTRAYDRHSQKDRLMIKYEDLRKNTLEETRKIHNFLGIKVEDSIYQDIAAVINDSVGAKPAGLQSWNEFFNEEERQKILEIMADMLQKLGYMSDKETLARKSASNPIVQNEKEIMRKKILTQKYDGYGVDPIPLVQLTPEQEDTLERNLVWILSNPRSGTTWLGTQLLSHNTHVWNEPLIGAHLVDLQETPECYIRDIDIRGKRRNYFFNEQYSLVWKRYIRKLILNRVYAQFKDVEQKVVIKEPNGSISADIISQCLPESKIISLVRDGRDTVDSRLDAITTGGWGTKFFGENSREAVNPEERPDVIRARSKLWRVNMETVMKAYENHHPANRIMIKYEDLRKNTLEETKKLYQFLGIPISDKKLKKKVDKTAYENIPDSKKGSGKFVRSASPGKWRDSFSEEEKKIMHDIMGSLLEKFGYLK